MGRGMTEAHSSGASMRRYSWHEWRGVAGLATQQVAGMYISRHFVASIIVNASQLSTSKPMSKAYSILYKEMPKSIFRGYAGEMSAWHGVMVGKRKAPEATRSMEGGPM